MRRTTVLLCMLLFVLGATTSSGLAGNDGDEHDFPRHPHVLLLHTQVTDEGGLAYERCVDLAGNQALRLDAHHHSLHMGQAGKALYENAGHLVIPMKPFPLLPFDWEGCDDVPAVLPPPPG